MSEQTVQCPICKQPYKTYDFFAGDQSACPSCVNKAKRNETNLDFNYGLHP